MYHLSHKLPQLLLALHAQGLTITEILTKDDFEEMVISYNKEGVESGHVFHMSSCLRNKNEINLLLQNDDDGANILSVVTASDNAYVAYQVVQKTAYFADNLLTRYAKWECGHGMTGMFDLVI